MVLHLASLPGTVPPAEKLLRGLSRREVCGATFKAHDGTEAGHTTLQIMASGYAQMLA